MLVVLDAFSLADPSVIEAVKKICDQIVYSRRILKEYSKVIALSSLQFELEKLRAMKPSKWEGHRPRPVGEVSGLGSQHAVFLKDAIGLDADFFVTRNPMWNSDGIELPRGCRLQIVTPEEYESIRRRSR